MKKTVAIFLSFLLFLSSTGLTYGQHFCGGKVVSEALMIGEKLLGCGTDKLPMRTSAEKPGCCQDVYHQIDTDDALSANYFDVEWPVLSVFNVPVPYAFTAPELPLFKRVVFSTYYPPPQIKDLPVLHQSFLI